MKKIITYVLIFMCLTLVGCKKNVDSIDVYSPNKEIIYGVYDVPESLIDSSLGISNELVGALFSGLIYKDKDGKINNQLCESYSVDENGLEYVFKLRRDIYWSNNEKITSRDFVSFFKNIIDDAKTIDEIDELRTVYGVEDYLKTKKEFDKFVAISSDGDLLKIRLNQKDDMFLDNLTKGKFNIKKDFLKLKDYRNFYKDIVYSGPYKITSINEENIVLEKNEKYFEDVMGEEKINIVIYNDNETALAAYETEKVNIIKNPPLSYLQNLSSKNQVIEAPSVENKFISYNISEGSTFSSIRIRKDFGEYLRGILSMEEFKERIPSEIINNLGNTEDQIKRDEPKSSLMELKSITIIAQDNEYNKETLKFVSEEGRKDNLIIYYKLLSNEEIEERLNRGNFSVYLGNIKSNIDHKGTFEEVALSIYKGEQKVTSTKKGETINAPSENKNEEMLMNSYYVSLYNRKDIIVKKDYINVDSYDYYGNLILKDIEIN